MAALVLAPLLFIVLSWQSSQVEVWQHLIATDLGRLLSNTLVLMLGVGGLVLLVGTSLAWLVALCEFPGRRWLDWALVLPLAIPTYVVAFVAMGVMGYSGPVLTLMRETFGANAWQPNVRSATGVVLVMSLVLYPYVYMLARSAFMQQGRSLMEAARSLGLGPWGAFYRVALPMARPAIVAGMSLALMEALADFGAVAIFNYDTFTTAIYKSWFGFFNLQAAAQLASLLMLFVGLALLAEQYARGRKRNHHPASGKGRIQLRGALGWGATAYCSFIFVVAFVVPLGQLALWVRQTGLSAVDVRFASLVGHTFFLGVIAGAVVVVMSFLVSFSVRHSNKPWVAPLVRLTALGYALPGSVLAVGIVVVFTLLDKNLLWPMLGNGAAGQILVGSVLALILAYTARYFSVGLGPVQSSMERIRPQLQEVAQSLGLNQTKVIWRVYIPMLTPGLLTALLLVLVDVMKEMPATLLMRPFGWDTLAVRIYEMTSEGEWERAALPAITLVLVSLIPVVLMIKRSRR